MVFGETGPGCLVVEAVPAGNATRFPGPLCIDDLIVVRENWRVCQLSLVSCQILLPIV